MSGLLALLDDVAAIAKLAATQLDDVSAQAMKAGTKAAGVVIDDAAVTPKYVTGLPATRELPIVWKIARGSLINKLVILLPIALLLNTFLPAALTPLLMLGGCYLCFEGAEKVWHVFFASKSHGSNPDDEYESMAHLETAKVKGAIKTDFILSAEIMAIALSTIETKVIWQEAVILAVVGVVITVGVYGAVALIVRADDWGLIMSQKGRLAATRAVGRAMVKVVPSVLKTLTIVGTAAMLWVGGNILVHGAHELGWHMPEETIKSVAYAVSEDVSFGKGLINWVVIAAQDAVVGIIAGLLIMFGMTAFKGKTEGANGQ